MAATIEEAVATAEERIGPVDKVATDWGDRWVFACAHRRQFGNGTAIIDKETGEDLGSLNILDEGYERPESSVRFDLPEGLYSEPFGGDEPFWSGKRS